MIGKSINCTAVMFRMTSSAPAVEWPPPARIPSSLYRDFTQGGEMPVSEYRYYAQRYSGQTAAHSIWTQEWLNRLVARHRDGQLIGGYSLYEERSLRDAFLGSGIIGTSGAVIGSETPWVEAIAFSQCPVNVTTIEYGSINSSISGHRAFTPREFAESFLRQQVLFDWVASVSSLEHSGLGRYGDRLNPRGDIEAAEECFCMLKPGGYFFISLPYSKKSHLRWNADRNYGPERMKYLAAGFHQIRFVGTLWHGQGVFVLQRPEQNHGKCTS